ncbi:hypothetical protein LPJ73_007861, partial [Coemansia sp. RSA 2703]
MDDEYRHSALGFVDSSEEEDIKDQHRKNARRNYTRKTKEDAMLGIWANDVNDKVTDRDTVDVLRPVNFVLSEDARTPETDTIPFDQPDPGPTDLTKNDLYVQTDALNNESNYLEPDSVSESSSDSDSDSNSDSASQSSGTQSDVPSTHNAPMQDVEQADSKPYQPPKKGFG